MKCWKLTKGATKKGKSEKGYRKRRGKGKKNILEMSEKYASKKYIDIFK